jgi:uncharacterized protein YpuA (DUF1002 family)
MEFFNKISDKIVSTGAEVSQKAKEVSQVVSLKNKIHTEEGKITQLYQNIGQKFFEDHKDDEDAAYAEDIRSIIAAKEGIRTLKEQINEINGTGTCPQCNETISADAAFCPKCGAKIEQ